MSGKDKGTALIVAMVVMVMIAGMATALLNLGLVRSGSADFRMEQSRAVQIAQAAVERAMARMKTLGAENADFGVDFVSYPTATPETFAGGEYFATVAGPSPTGDPDVDLWTILATARAGGALKTVETTVRRKRGIVLPAPFPQSGSDSMGALGIFGKVGKKAKLKLPGHLVDPADLDPGEDNDDTKDHLVTISGIDASDQGINVLGLAVSDSEAYAKMLDEIIKKMAEGKIPEAVFSGDPVNEFTHEGTTVNTSIGRLSGAPDIDPQALIDMAETITNGVWNDLIPNATRTITGNNEEIDTDTVWGTTENPEITVVDAKKLKIDGGATVSGAGTLVVLGSLDIHHADLTWDGDIIILGEDTDRKKRDSKLHNHHGTLNVDGTIVVLGTGKGKTSLNIHNDNRTDDSGSSITGAVVLMSGAEDKKGKVEFKAKHGSLSIDGLLMMLGHQVKLDLHPEHHHEGAFSLEGGLVLGVGEFAEESKKKKSKLDVKIKGDVSIRKDSDKIDRALALIEALLGRFPTDPGAAPTSVYTYTNVVWREVPTPRPLEP